MFYGLGTMQDTYYKHKLARFIAISPCVFLADELKVLFGYKRLVALFGLLKIFGIHYVLPMSFKEDIQSLLIFVYYYQLLIEDRYQEPVPLYQYAAGIRRSKEIKLSSIDKVPVSLIVGGNDNVCSAFGASRVFEELGNPSMHSIEILSGKDHFYFGKATSTEYLDLLEETILQENFNQIDFQEQI